MDDAVSDLIDFGNAIAECGENDSRNSLHAFLMASIPRKRLPLVFWPIVVGALQTVCLQSNGDTLVPGEWYATVQNGRFADIKAAEASGDGTYIRLAGSKVPVSTWPAVALPDDFIVHERDPQPLRKKLADRINRDLNTKTPCNEWMRYSLKPIVVVTRNVDSVLQCLHELLDAGAFGRLDELGSLILEDAASRGHADLRNDCYRTPILVTTGRSLGPWTAQVKAGLVVANGWSQYESVRRYGAFGSSPVVVSLSPRDENHAVSIYDYMAYGKTAPLNDGMFRDFVDKEDELISSIPCLQWLVKEVDSRPIALDYGEGDDDEEDSSEEEW